MIDRRTDEERRAALLRDMRIVYPERSDAELEATVDGAIARRRAAAAHGEAALRAYDREVINSIRAAFASVPDDEIDTEIAKTIAEVREETRRERAEQERKARQSA